MSDIPSYSLEDIGKRAVRQVVPVEPVRDFPQMQALVRDVAQSCSDTLVFGHDAVLPEFEHDSRLRVVSNTAQNAGVHFHTYYVLCTGHSAIPTIQTDLPSAIDADRELAGFLSDTFTWDTEPITLKIRNNEGTGILEQRRTLLGHLDFVGNSLEKLGILERDVDQIHQAFEVLRELIFQLMLIDNGGDTSDILYSFLRTTQEGIPKDKREELSHIDYAAVVIAPFHPHVRSLIGGLNVRGDEELIKGMSFFEDPSRSTYDWSRLSI